MLAGQKKTDASFPHILSLSRNWNLGEDFSEEADGRNLKGIKEPVAIRRTQEL